MRAKFSWNDPINTQPQHYISKLMKTEIVEQRLDTGKRELELEVDQPFYQI